MAARLHTEDSSADNTDCAMQHVYQILTVRAWRIYNLYLMVKTQQINHSRSKQNMKLAHIHTYDHM